MPFPEYLSGILQFAVPGQLPRERDAGGASEEPLCLVLAMSLKGKKGKGAELKPEPEPEPTATQEDEDEAEECVDRIDVSGHGVVRSGYLATFAYPVRRLGRIF